MPESRLLPFIRVAIELEAGLFGTKELAENKLTNNPQLQ